MSFQTDDLALLALGILEDQPPDTVQPRLPDGMHCRWVFAEERGFPWHGYYLFRRESLPQQPLCLSPHLEGIPPGSQELQLETPLGRLSSIQPLAFIEEFSPAGVAEVDLDRTAPLRFDLPAGVEARQIDLRIGMRSVGPQSVRVCIDFPDPRPSPWKEKGAVFTVDPLPDGKPGGEKTALTSIEPLPDSSPGLPFIDRLEIEIPCPATRVDLLLTSQGGLRIEGIEEDGTSVEVIPPGGLRDELVTLTGRALVRIVIESSFDALSLLHEICWECPDAGPPGRQVLAAFEDWPVGERPNPVIEQGVRFEVRDQKGIPREVAIFEKRVQTWTGLNAQHQVEILLPCPTTSVILQFSRGSNDPAVRLQAFNQDDTLADEKEMNVGLFGAEWAELKGESITRILVHAPGEAALLHHVVFLCAPAPETGILVRFLAGAMVVSETLVTGQAGEIVSFSLEEQGVTAVEIGPGQGALVDLCVRFSQQGDTSGWNEIPDFQYPLCLPVFHADYPCPGRPASETAALDLALSRITYGDSDPETWESDFSDLHDQLEILVKGGPAGGPMANRVNPVLEGDPLGPAPDAEPFRLKDQRALDLVLLASLDPAIAQMLGLYFVDASAEHGVPYDYLLLADPTGVLGGSAATALEWLAFQPDLDAVDAWLARDKTVASAPPLPPPGQARVYALPGATTRDEEGTLNEAVGNVGLWWEVPPEEPPEGTEEEPVFPVLYHPRRALLGTAPPPNPPPDEIYGPLRPEGSAVVVAQLEDPPPPPAPGETQSSPEWPPSSVSFHVIDSGLPEGWYSYCVLAQDLFGRHSPMGPPAVWYQWDPPAGTPPPWYFQPPGGHRPVHTFAVALLDKIPPPPPAGIEAAALDPLDRWVLQDAPYTAWRADNPDAVGLRVSWRWTLEQRNQAPDTREFRIYYIPGRLNELPSGISLDALRRSTSWAQRLHTVPYANAVEETLEISRDPENRPLDESSFGNVGATAAGTTAQLPPDVDLAGVQPWLDHLYLDGDTARPSRTYRVERVDPTLRTLTLDAEPDLGGLPSPWTIGRPVRLYDVFLPAPDTDKGQPFFPTLDQSTVFAQIGVSAADDKTHTADDPKWVPPDADRFGNEGPVGGPAAVYRVLQTPPDPPELADYFGKLWATRADYHSRSFFTFRWKPHTNVNVKTHVLRALDDSLILTDREHRPRPALDLTKPADAALFPADWSQTRRDEVVTKLNELNQAGADYAILSDDALQILAGLPGNEEAFTQITLQPLDSTEVLDQRGPDDPIDYVIRPSVRAYLDELPGKATNRYLYRAAFVDGAHNRSGFSFSTPPVYLPKVVPPRAPVITKVVGGDQKITLYWETSPEPDVVEYRVYRALSAQEANDIRRMALVHSEGTTDDPQDRPHWADEPLRGRTTYFYRLLAKNSSGAFSRASKVVAAQAYDQRPPEPPIWISGGWTPDGSAIALKWISSDEGVMTLVSRRFGSTWLSISPWLPSGVSQFLDSRAPSDVGNRYRLRVRSTAGNLNLNYHELAVEPRP